jgi:pimeloyl-ACP methyl ester carboxylesterase
MRIPRSRAVLAGLACAALVATGCSPDDSTVRPPTYVLGEHASYRAAPCPDPLVEGLPKGQLAGFVCGLLTVPQSRADPTGPTIELSVAVAKAASPNPQPDPVVYLVGGPGGMGMQAGPFLVGEGWNADRDLILLNQRGTPRTDPALVCPELDRFAAEAVNLAMTDPAVASRRVHVVGRCHDRLAGTGAELAAFTTTENAADVADLRVAMGIRAWNVVGSSYGTDLVLQLVRSYPEGIRSVVLDSVIPPQVNLAESRWRSLALATDAVFDACEAQPACQHAYPEVRQEFSRLLTELTGQPRHVQVPDPSTGAPTDVTIDSYTLLNVLSIAAAQPGGFAPVPAMIHDLAGGGGQQAAQYAMIPLTLPPGLTGYGLLYGVVCREYAPQTSQEAIDAQAQQAFPGVPEALTVLVPNLGRVFDECARWNVPPAPDDVSAPVRSDLPTLLLSGTFDTQTRSAYADEAATTLPNAIHRIIPGAGHVLAAGYPCAHTMIMSFLDDPAGVDDSCLASVEVPPFTVPS